MAQAQVPTAADEQPRRRGDDRLAGRLRRARLPLLVVDQLEDIVHFLIAALLLAVAGYVMYRTTVDLLSSHTTFPSRVTSAINDVLFVIILLELLRTVVAHFDTAELQLEPFLIIGIISAVRHLLSVGAHLTLGSSQGHDAFNRSQIELGVSTGVVVALALALVLIRRIPADASVDR
jgi:uncharacterized membrane protein (DUF373 family)